MDDNVANPNLELIINNDKWNVIILVNHGERPYFMTNLLTKTLYINNVNIDKAKHFVWQNHHEEYKENYYG